MNYLDNQYITANDLSFRGVLHGIKKSRTALQPVFEAFTNALEAIKIKSKDDRNFNGEIYIKINSQKILIKQPILIVLSFPITV